MTEEQRYREQIQIEKDKVQLLKRIAEALDIIAASYAQQKYKMDMSEDFGLPWPVKERRYTFGENNEQAPEKEEV